MTVPEDLLAAIEAVPAARATFRSPGAPPRPPGPVARPAERAFRLSHGLGQTRDAKSARPPQGMRRPRHQHPRDPGEHLRPAGTAHGLTFEGPHAGFPLTPGRQPT